MSLEPEVALEEFLSAVRAHFTAAAQRTDEHDARVEATYMALADAFELYEDAIYTAFDEVTPFELFDDVEDAKDDDGYELIDDEDDIDSD